MLNPKVKQGIQVAVSLTVAVWIFWFLYKDIEMTSLMAQLRSSNWFWIVSSLAISLFGFWVRGWRWALLIQADEGKPVTSNRAYHAVMVGYLANMLVPRAGEVARCGVLSRTNGISVGHLIGTVILERSIDLVFLTGTILLAFVLENKLFLALAGELVDVKSLGQKLFNNLPILLGGLIIFFLFLYFLFKRFRNHGIVNKLQNFGRQLLSGVKSISTLKNPIGFWASSFLIWIIYFLTMYLVSLAIQSTANLTPGEVLLVMVMGSIGMIAPVQGGIGTFHALVAYILIQFGVSDSDGKIFAAIIHGTQTIMVVVVGLISWIAMMRIPAWIKPDKA
ncbi:lysylphosphatidylglycerol synthase transmembrane domain-containing protein [Algoriphagus sp.]|uniref:lysylphosphatidylglycerol synthase transmembrane domain-containing protein n=1 Tax=Algoriphagus sp. TaxID=1872435 RepID=UPI00271F8361|nr:lysylphosphatidylglycerol synthase transmembrane domain-containing protein [Algoriphagus sp.]MDO8965658.1 lysylphosphatidylglycerol synthase transmembrane domain-containing protein [Algoriphagus sp.]MDP3200505.1 lysylphosphatidylglycerol synthase transmembrane domain-containing protein [Algoriphagus sp.]